MGIQLDLSLTIKDLLIELLREYSIRNWIYIRDREKNWKLTLKAKLESSKTWMETKQSTHKKQTRTQNYHKKTFITEYA